MAYRKKQERLEPRYRAAVLSGKSLYEIDDKDVEMAEAERSKWIPCSTSGAWTAKRKGFEDTLSTAADVQSGKQPTLTSFFNRPT